MLPGPSASRVQQTYFLTQTIGFRVKGGVAATTVMEGYYFCSITIWDEAERRTRWARKIDQEDKTPSRETLGDATIRNVHASWPTLGAIRSLSVLRAGHRSWATTLGGASVSSLGVAGDLHGVWCGQRIVILDVYRGKLEGSVGHVRGAEDRQLAWVARRAL